MPLWTNSVPPKWDFVSNTVSRHGYNKRNVIALDSGWVHRVRYTDKHGTSRTKDEILVAIPRLAGAAKGHAFPQPVEVYVANTTGGSSLNPGDLGRVYVVYNEPLSWGGAGSNTGARLRLTVANTAGGNSCYAWSNGTVTSLGNADNTLVFKFDPASAGTYKIQAQAMANTVAALTIRSRNTGTELANLVITAAVSNALGTFVIA